jgi:hypothetical protein
MVSSLFLAAALSIQGWTILSDSEPDALAGCANRWPDADAAMRYHRSIQ